MLLSSTCPAGWTGLDSVLSSKNIAPFEGYDSHIPVPPQILLTMAV